MMRRHRCRSTPRGLVMLLVVATAGCGQKSPRARTDPKAGPALVHEQQRRIAAYDSVVRSVNTDSLFKLWHLMLRASDLRKAQLAMMCEYTRLSDRYGKAAFVAIKRMSDTLWKHDDPKLVDDMDRRLVGESPGIGRDTCGPPPDKSTPDWLMRWYVPALPALPPSPDSAGTR